MVGFEGDFLLTKNCVSITYELSSFLSRLNQLLWIALKMQVTNSFDLMNSARVKALVFTAMPFLLILFACQAFGQDVEAFSFDGNVGVDSSHNSVLVPGESVDQLEPFQVLDHPAMPVEPMGLESLGSQWPLPCEACEPQVVKTKGKCSLSEEIVCVSGRDEIWLVSARQSHLCQSDLSRLEVSLLRDSQWQLSSLETLTSAHAGNRSRATFVYCHGNRTKLAFAKSRGLQVYEALFQNEVDQSTRPPVRFVIFAWKSEQEKVRLRTDYEIKSKRAFAVGSAFGKFLDQFADRNMLLGGFSLGSQVVLAGLTGCESKRSNLDGRYQVALTAPALDPSFVCSSLRQLPENSLIERTEVFANENDFAIKAAQKLAAKTCRKWLPELMKLANIMGINPIQVHEVGKEISSRHSIANYYNSRSVRCIHRKMLEQVYAAQQSGERIEAAAGRSLAPSVLVEAEPSEIVPIAGLDGSDFVTDLLDEDTEVPVLASPAEFVPGETSN